jgi:hypothetical protein
MLEDAIPDEHRGGSGCGGKESGDALLAARHAASVERGRDQWSCGRKLAHVVRIAFEQFGFQAGSEFWGRLLLGETLPQRPGNRQQGILRPLRHWLAVEQAFQFRVERLAAILVGHATPLLPVRGKAPVQGRQRAMQQRFDRSFAPLHDPGDFLVP